MVRWGHEVNVSKFRLNNFKWVNQIFILIQQIISLHVLYLEKGETRRKRHDIRALNSSQAEETSFMSHQITSFNEK